MLEWSSWPSSDGLKNHCQLWTSWQDRNQGTSEVERETYSQTEFRDYGLCVGKVEGVQGIVSTFF